MENSASASYATQTRIIHPPADIKTIVDKTASFVARNEPEFEKRIYASNAGNPKFKFLNGSDPYHAYYKNQLSEALGLGSESTLLAAPVAPGYRRWPPCSREI